jgi:hypothetical protein
MTYLVRTLCSISNVLAIGMLCLPSVVLATLITWFETGDLDGWNAPDVNGCPSSVNTARASDGVIRFKAEILRFG